MTGRVLYRVLRVPAMTLTRLWFRLRVHGRARVPRAGSFIVAPVHRSNLDFLVAASITGRRVRFMAKDSLWKVGVFGRFLSVMGAFPVRRGSADREALRVCGDVIEAGEPLVLFPEGTRREGPTIEHVFDGAAYLAARTGVPVVPIGIGGSARAMPRGAKWVRPTRIDVVVGAPITVEKPSGGGRVPRRAVRELSQRLQAELQGLFDEAQAKAGTPNR